MWILNRQRRERGGINHLSRLPRLSRFDFSGFYLFWVIRTTSLVTVPRAQASCWPFCDQSNQEI